MELGIRISQIKSESGVLKEFARHSRKNMTSTEAVVWERLRGKRLQGLRFRRQHALLGYVLDFYCHEKRLCIELDGTPHEEPKQKTRDALRDETLRSHGYTILRFTNNEAIYSPDRFRLQILDACHLSPNPT